MENMRFHLANFEQILEVPEINREYFVRLDREVSKRAIRLMN